MKTLSLKLDTATVQLSPEEQKKTPAQVVLMVVDSMVQSYMQIKGGFEEPDRRKWYKIEDAIEDAIKSGAEEVVLEDDWWGWLKTVRREAKMRPVKLMRAVDALFDAVQER